MQFKRYKANGMVSHSIKFNLWIRLSIDRKNFSFSSIKTGNLLKVSYLEDIQRFKFSDLTFF